MIDLRSDTVTQPTAAMREAMFAAPVGDDVFSEDPTVNELERRSAELFGMEAALFMPSGTMCNQVAIKLHTQPLDEVITHRLSHIQLYEGAGFAFHSGVMLKLMDGPDGKIRAKEIAPGINPDLDWVANTRMVMVENTMNKAGGTCYSLAELQAISETCRQHNLRLHLDGARIFNALVATEVKPQEVGPLFDSLSFCLSKGLGCPVGSVLVGKKAFIKQARKLRKVMGGGMRQVGFLAAAGIYALENHIERLKDDHQRANELAKTLTTLPFIEEVLPAPTNIVLLRVAADWGGSERLAKELAQHGIRTFVQPERWMRLVTHLDFGEEGLEEVVRVLKLLG